jgi:hypothetical protein
MRGRNFPSNRVILRRTRKMYNMAVLLNVPDERYKTGIEKP